MLATIYRYPHPIESNRFIYVGQTTDAARRHHNHKFGGSSFGRRFKNEFPGIELPQPILETVKVEDHFELNELETISMFRYHTWRGYEGGMNLAIPGSKNYQYIDSSTWARNAGRIGGRSAVKSGQLARARTSLTSKSYSEMGKKGGQKHIESGHIFMIQTAEGSSRGGHTQGQHNVKSGHMARIQKLSTHNRYHIALSIVKPGCDLCKGLK